MALALGAWAGALTYFLWPTNPPLAWGLGLLGVACCLLALPRDACRWLGWWGLAAGTLWGLATWEVARQQHAAFPWEEAASRSHWVVGQVARIAPQPLNPRRATLELQPYHLFGVMAGPQAPARLRVGVWASQVPGVITGTVVAASVRFLPPNASAMPGVRDGRLWQWFGTARASAYVTGPLEPSADGMRYFVQNRNIADDIFAYMQGWRAQVVQGSAGLGQGVVAALLVGEQGKLPPAVREAYRASGLSHLLAISGMQLTLVGLGLFALLRYIGACWPGLVLRVNLKAWAALGALLGVIGYTLLVGAAPSIVRAALMVGLVLLAVLLGRVRGVLRAWAVASLLILVLQPHLAMSAGLQLSAAATLALALWASQATPPRGVTGWATATLLASVVAGAATAPIVALHFGVPASVGVLANLVAIPLMTLASYAGFAALALWPLGLAPLALAPMTWLVELTTAWATWVAGWQVSASPPLGGVGIGLLTLVALATVGFTLLRRWGWLALVTVASMAGLWAWGLWAPRPQVIVAEGGMAGWSATNAAATSYRLAWAENPTRAAWLARLARLPVVAAEPPACCADEMILPKHYETLAYATYQGDRWVTQPWRCGRPWQQLAEVCWGQHRAMKGNDKELE